ncbi:MAG: hypothetical protein MUP81_04540 [Dehalococcoidia bacterium]|nr:hypothetical protein [Dehalococcoidia bacterium]
MTRLGSFIANIFTTIFEHVLASGKTIFSTLIDWYSVAWAHGFEIFFDILSAGLLNHTQKTIDKMVRQTGLPPSDAASIREMLTAEGEAGALVGQVGLSQTTGGVISSILGPWLKLVEYNANQHAVQQRFDPKTALAIKFRRGRPGRSAEAHVRELIGKDLKDQGWSEERSELLEDVAHSRLKEELLVTLRLRKIITQQNYLDRMYFLGYDFEEAEDFYTSLLAYPGISDIVRMAVREAYTPEIAEKFGQYQDIPPQFITEAAKVGIPEEIARQYWAAHWDLPSPMQGFDMLHRGIITQDELKLLLRALDVMPFWRDKLISLAYTPFTRVDVRRMHKARILTRDQVKQSYKDIGYNDEKAEALTQFTIALNAGTATDAEKELSKAEILSAYKNRLISEQDATDALGLLGYDDAAILLLIGMSQGSAALATRDLTLSQIQSLYQKGLRSKLECTSWLTAMKYDAGEIEALYSLWDWESPASDRLPSRTDLDNFLIADVIDLTQWSNEYTLLGYDLKYQEWYFAYLVEKGKIEG